MPKFTADALPSRTARLRFEQCLRKYARPVQYDAWCVAFGLGLRIGDCLALRWSDIDQFGRVTFQPQKQRRETKDGKPKQPRVVVKRANDRVREILDRRRAEHPSDVYVFQSRWGAATRTRPYTRSAMQKAWKHAAERGGMKGLNVSTHTARKTIGLHMHLDRQPIEDICVALYQQDIRATMHYLGITQRRIDDLMAAYGQ